MPVIGRYAIMLSAGRVCLNLYVMQARWDKLDHARCLFSATLITLLRKQLTYWVNLFVDMQRKRRDGVKYTIMELNTPPYMIFIHIQKISMRTTLARPHKSTRNSL